MRDVWENLLLGILLMLWRDVRDVLTLDVVREWRDVVVGLRGGKGGAEGSLCK